MQAEVRVQACLGPSQWKVPGAALGEMKEHPSEKGLPPPYIKKWFHLVTLANIDKF